jgi:aerobic-type carbon monoxide dehydrogenase small subunit (CoxS/CutS family)
METRIEESTRVILNVNGEEHQVEVYGDETLVSTLRERLGLTGTNVMCDEGACGSCTVLIDGTPVLSCMTLAIESEGKEITTIEGLADAANEQLHPIQRAFVDLSGMQCGTCTPAMILTAKSLLDRNTDPSEDDVREALSGNLCRCGHYKAIVQSVLLAADRMKKDKRSG